MFSPKEDFQTVELHLEHVKEAIKKELERIPAKFTDLRGYVEDELSGMKTRIEHFEQRVRAIEANLDDRFTTVFDRIAGIERPAKQPTPVNTPPAPIEPAKSQDNSQENSQASTANASE